MWREKGSEIGRSSPDGAESCTTLDIVSRVHIAHYYLPRLNSRRRRVFVVFVYEGIAHACVTASAWRGAHVPNQLCGTRNRS